MSDFLKVSDFVVAGDDHFVPVSALQPAANLDELCYNKGDFVMVVAPLEGVGAEGKVDP